MVDATVEGSDVVAFRKHWGISQHELANMLSVSDVTMRKWENGYNKPKNKTIELFLDIKNSIEEEKDNAKIVRCPHCEQRAEMKTGKETCPWLTIFAKRNFYICKNCRSWVICKPGTRVATGPLTRAEGIGGRQFTFRDKDDCCADCGISAAETKLASGEGFGIKGLLCAKHYSKRNRVEIKKGNRIQVSLCRKGAKCHDCGVEASHVNLISGTRFGIYGFLCHKHYDKRNRERGKLVKG